MTIKVNVEKAKAIAVDAVRAARVEKLEALDIELRNAQLAGDDVGGIASRRRALLDATNGLKAVTHKKDVMTLAEADKSLKPLMTLPE